MLQIKNTLGGGKPNAPYAWAKYTKVYQEIPEEQTNVDIVSNSVSGGDTFVYYSDTYTYDDSTGNFSIGDDAPYVRARSGSSGWDALRGKYVIQELGSKGFSAKTGKVLIKIGESATFFQSNNHYVYDYALATSDATVYVYGDVYTFIEYITDKSPTKYPNGEVHTDGYFYRYAPEGLYVWKKCENNTDHTFIDYVVSDKETAYPDGGEKGGYWYERVGGGITPEMFGCTKMAVDTYTPAANIMMGDVTLYHSLGKIPRLVIIVSDNMDSYEKGTYRQTIKIGFITNWNGSANSNFSCNAVKSYDGANSNSANTNANVTLSSSYIRGNTNYVPGVNYLYGGDKYTIYTFA